MELRNAALKREKAEVENDLRMLTSEVKALKDTDSQLKAMFNQLQQFHMEIIKSGKIS